MFRVKTSQVDTAQKRKGSKSEKRGEVPRGSSKLLSFFTFRLISPKCSVFLVDDSMMETGPFILDRGFWILDYEGWTDING